MLCADSMFTATSTARPRVNASSPSSLRCIGSLRNPQTIRSHSASSRYPPNAQRAARRRELRHVLHHGLPLMLATPMEAKTLSDCVRLRFEVIFKESGQLFQRFVLWAVRRHQATQQPVGCSCYHIKNMGTCFSSAISLAAKYSSTRSR